MSPTVIYLILSMVEEAIKDTPGIVADLRSIFSNPNPSPADWENLRAKVLSKSYADYVPATALASDAALPVPVAAVTPPAESNAPITQPGATPAPEIPAQEQNQPDPDPVTSTTAASESPYLPDGTANPNFKA